MLDSNPPLTLYVHIPWCVQKCPYCDFNSHQIKSSLDEKKYLNALMEDLEGDLPLIWGRPIQSIFIGGGTPSTFNPEAIAQLLSDIRARVKISPFAEITMEANPGTVDQARFKGYREAGINRLSLGIQSFNDEHLKALGRIHDSKSARNAIEAAKKAGFENFNLDLMFGLPNQSKAQAKSDLSIAIEFDPTHISYYQLTIEANTYFAQFPPALPDDELIDESHDTGIECLAENGYRRYEVSAFAHKDYECFHNRNYWEFGDYLGIGAGAHSKITHVPSERFLRRWKHKHPKDYLGASKLAGETEIEKDQLVSEFMMNALRLIQGFNLSLFQARTGLAYDSISTGLKRGRELGLLHH
ncbi:MAG: radical SAM family heme chaperone HemW, partial [Gammaproteobacteria bacterium]|nr:radical SAM family heme chaperone HemW [Gammaproteobacteria bacterium]